MNAENSAPPTAPDLTPSFWPRRRFALLEAGRPNADDFGFVIPSESDITAEQLTNQPVVLVIAPPWTGKSYVAKQIERACHQEQRPFVIRTPLEELGPSSRVPPGWWDEWKESTDKALWIVDSVDEDNRAASHRAKDLLREVQDLPEACRARLGLLVFCREAEVPDYFRARLRDMWEEVQEVRLLPLDQQSAAELVPAGKFDQVCELVRGNRLTSIAALPAVLEVLDEYAPGASLNAAEVWRSVLLNLLVDKKEGRDYSEIDDLFTVTTRLAIVASFCGPHALAKLSSVPQAQTSFDHLIRRDENLSSELRLAARRAMKTVLFTQTTQGLRFAQDHTREWLAAFGMESWSPGQVRPLVTQSNGKLDDRHRGLLGILWQVSANEAVKNWIVEASGGIVPPSDAAPWSLNQALLALDRLTDLARRSAWGLDFWGAQESLECFRVPGIQTELTQRLEAESDPLGQRLLLRVAEVVGAEACSKRALEIALDPNVQEGLGDIAMSLLGRAGDPLTMEELQKWLNGEFLRGQESPHLPRILRAAAVIMLERGLWGWDRGARASLQWSWNMIDSPRHSVGERGSGPTPTAARDFVSWAAGELAAGRHELRYGEIRFGMRKALEMALQAIANDLDLSDADAQLLVRLADSAPGGLNDGFYLVLQAVQSFEGARRAFFRAVLDHRPGKDLPRLAFLGSEDLYWLRSEIERRNGRPERIWEHFYALFQDGKADSLSREEARAFMGLRVPELLKQKDQARTDMEARFGQSTIRPELAEEPTYKLADLIEEALRAEGWPLENRFQRIAWLCFSDVARPTDVEGSWIELPRELKVLSVLLCRRAFDELEPTIRTDQSIPGRMLFEAEGFQFLVDNALLDLTKGLIAKWLPTVLSVPESRQSEVVRKAFEAHRPASEAALLQWLESILQIDPDEARSISLPAEFWSAELAGKILDLADGPHVGTDAKAALYWQCVPWQKERVLSEARDWCEQEASPELGHHGLDLLMVHSPKDGLPWLLKLPATQESLERTRWIDSSPEDIVAGLGWAERANLFDFLWRACPPEPDDDDGFRSTGVVEWGSQAGRGALLNKFSEEISDPAARAAIDGLASRIEWVREWRDHRLTSQDAAGMLSRKRDPSTGEPWVEVDQLLATIHSSERRFLRSVSDLQESIVEEILAIGKDALKHLAMLYHPSGTGVRKRLHEEALQAYLHCRLSDRLASRLEPRPTIHINREPLAARNERNDLKIEAAALGGQPLAVVIEVKWSDHKDLWTALPDQLAKRYLRDTGLTHGIYLVGDCGELAGKRPQEEKPLDLAEFFRSQALREEGLSIQTLVLDLRWQAQPASSLREALGCG